MICTYTHKGWFLFCPVYIGNMEGENVRVMARHPILEPWMTANEWMTAVGLFFIRLIKTDLNSVALIVLTEELNPPKRLLVD